MILIGLYILFTQYFTVILFILNSLENIILRGLYILFTQYFTVILFRLNSLENIKVIRGLGCL